MKYVIIIFLTALSGLFSGLILGLMSMSPFELERKSSLGDTDAKAVYPIRRKGNLVLVTLVFGTTVVNAILTVFLNSVSTGLVAVLLATLLIMLFGTLLPQALFSRIALWVGARFAPFVNLVMWLFWPICAPIAKLLDIWLGQELPTLYSKEELLKIIEEHKRSPNAIIEADEERITRGALSFGDKKVSEVMVPRRMMVAVEKNTLLTPAKINELKASAHSRLPVFENDIDHIVGTLYAHDLVGENNAGKKAIDIADAQVHYIKEDALLDQLLNSFLRTRHHLYIVRNAFHETVGVISLEDVLEVILGKRIIDEFDVYKDVRQTATQA